jgi:hypothetical protein
MRSTACPCRQRMRPNSVVVGGIACEMSGKDVLSPKRRSWETPLSG